MKLTPFRLLRSSGGIAAVEFAFVAPVFILMTTGAIDFGYIQWGRSQLNGATAVAGRQIIQTRNPDGTSRTTAERQGAFTATVNAAMASFAEPAGQNTTVAIRKYSNFTKMISEPYIDGSRDPNGNGVIDPAERNGSYDLGETYTELNDQAGRQDEVGVSNDLGGVGEVVKIDVTYPMKPLFSYSAAVFGTGGSIVIGSTTVFRNEPE